MCPNPWNQIENCSCQFRDNRHLVEILSPRSKSTLVQRLIERFSFLPTSVDIAVFSSTSSVMCLIFKSLSCSWENTLTSTFVLLRAQRARRIGTVLFCSQFHQNPVVEPRSRSCAQGSWEQRKFHDHLVAKSGQVEFYTDKLTNKMDGCALFCFLSLNASV